MAEPGRTPAQRQWFSGERKQSFNKKLRSAAEEDATRERDLETRRMEEYRRLCQREGIQSKRLADYDERKAVASKAIDGAINAVQHDESLSNATKKKKIFQIRRKAATRRSVMVLPTSGLAAKISHLESHHEDARKEKEAEIEKRVRAKQEKMHERAARNKHFAQRTSSGQPVMATRVAALLDKIKKSAYLLFELGFLVTEPMPHAWGVFFS
jgi:hypothetical protein